MSGKAATPRTASRTKSTIPQQRRSPLGKAAERTAWVSLCAMIFLVPVATTNLSGLHIGAHAAFWNDPDSAKALAFFALSGVTVAAWLVSFAVGGRVRWHDVGWVLAALLGWAALSSAFAVEPRLSIFGDPRRPEGLATWLAYVGVAFVALQVVSGTARLRRALECVVAAGAVSALWGLAQVAGIDQRKAQVVVCFCQRGIQFDRAAQRSQRV